VCVADIVLFMGVSRDGDNLYLMQEFISGGSLSHILGNKDVELPWRTRVRMALDTASALLYLHNKKCLHRVQQAHSSGPECHSLTAAASLGSKV